MPAITRANHCKIESGTNFNDATVARMTDGGSVMETTPPKRKLRSSDVQRQQSPNSAPVSWKSPRRRLNSSPKCPPQVSLIGSFQNSMHFLTVFRLVPFFERI